MKTTLEALRTLAAVSLAAALTAGCAVTSGLDDSGPGGTVSAVGASPASERVVPGVAELVLTTRAWPTFEEARADPVKKLEDGSPLYAYIRATRPLGELAHPSTPGGTYAFSDYPHLFLQVGDTDSLRILGTCYITLTNEEAGMRELVVPLAPLTFRPGQIPADCWLASVVGGRSGLRTYEVRLAGFAGKFESWLPVPDLLAVTPVPSDFSNGAGEYATMLRATPLRSATLVASTSPMATATPAPYNPAALSPVSPNPSMPASTQPRPAAVVAPAAVGAPSPVPSPAPSAAAGATLSPLPSATLSPAPSAAFSPAPGATPGPAPSANIGPAPSATPGSAPGAAMSPAPAGTTGATPGVTTGLNDQGSAPRPVPAAVSYTPAPRFEAPSQSPSTEPVIATPVPESVILAQPLRPVAPARPVPNATPVPAPPFSSAPVSTVPAATVPAATVPSAAAPAAPVPAPAALAPPPAPAMPMVSPAPSASNPSPRLVPFSAGPTYSPTPGEPTLATVSPSLMSQPNRRPALVATNNAPLPGPRQDIGNSRMELQLQSLTAALLGRRPSEAFFMDGQWTSTSDPRGRVWQQSAHAAAIFKGASCSWQRIRAFRRPGASGLLDVEPAGEPIEINCSDLK